MAVSRRAPGSSFDHPVAAERRRGGEDRAERRPPDFATLLCAIDGSRNAMIAARQAIALCRPGASLRFLALAPGGEEQAPEARLRAQRAREALAEASWQARQAGVDATAELRESAEVVDALLVEGGRRDVLVLGCRGGSRPAGIMLGSTARRIAQRSEQPLVIGRRTADGGDFPQSILISSDGSAGSWAAVEAAGRIAAGNGAELRIVSVGLSGRPVREPEVHEQMAEIERLTGAPPSLVAPAGPAGERILEAARGWQSSLIVIGRRSAAGPNGLGSVSGPVVQRAPCSVLAMPA